MSLSRRAHGLVRIRTTLLGIAVAIAGGAAVGHAQPILPGDSPHRLTVGPVRNDRWSLEVRYPGAPGNRVILNGRNTPAIAALDPAALIGKTVTVYRNGRVVIEPTTPLEGPPTSVEPRPPGAVFDSIATAFLRGIYGWGTFASAWGDYDRDGHLDLPLYRNQVGSFAFIPGFWNLLDRGNYHGSSWCDYDRDGDVDLVILSYNFNETTSYGTLLLRNDGAGGFTDVAPMLGMDLIGRGETPVWGDFDGDGWPDLFAPYHAHRIPELTIDRSFFYHNNGNGTFTEMAEEAGVSLIGSSVEAKPEGASAVDWDDDGDLDLYAASHLFLNDGTGHFTDVAAAVGLPEQFDEGCGFVDYDNDGDFDLYTRYGVDRIGVDGAQLWRNDGGRFVNVTEAAGIGTQTFMWGDSWADVDNDGDLDLVQIEQGDVPWESRASRLMLNRGDGTFVPDDAFPASVLGPNAWGDYDSDGDLDFVDNVPPSALYSNRLLDDTNLTGSSLFVRVVDADGRQVSHGATVLLRRVNGPQERVQARAVGGGTTYLCQNDYVVHFGLGWPGTVLREPTREEYEHGQLVQITAVPSPGYHFVKWTGDAAGTENPLTVSMTSTMDVRALFRLDDAIEPVAQVVSPNAGELLGVGTIWPVRWTASDSLGGVDGVDVWLSRIGPDGPWEQIASRVPNSGRFDWRVTGPPTEPGDARLRVVASDAEGNTGADESDGGFTIGANAGVDDSETLAFGLSTFTPNPAHGVTRGEFTVARASRIQLTVHDVQGRLVATLADGVYRPGRHRVEWHPERASHAGPGLYFVRLVTPEGPFERRIAIVR
jgi:uncharacterized repeat protein (TIGR02543 family)